MSDLVDWLKGHGLERYAPVFAANDVDLSTLDLLDDNDLASLGISLGNRRRLLAALSRMAEGRAVSKRELLSAGEPERRILSVVFIDIVGSVELFQRIDAEEMHELTKQFQSAVTAATLRYGGYVAQFAGDGVLSYFGWPQAHEDDAERAVRAAREAHEAIGAILHDSEPVLKARAGVATGEVVVGTIEGEILKDDGAAIGATLGLASRLQHLARPFEVVIGPLTRKLLAGTFALEDIGEYTLKGFAAPIRAWRIAGEETGVTRYERARAPGRSKLVGRAGDLRTLRAGWDAAKAGDGRLISISGDPGIGKSRLLEEFRTELHGERRFGFRYQCSPHHTNTALYPAIQNLRRTAGLAAAESDAARIEKLRRYLSLAPELLEHALPRLAALLRIDWSGRAAMDALPAQALRREVIACLVEHVLAMSKQHTVLLAVEDVHWADATTLDFIAQLAERIAGRPILMLLTHRPEFEPEWQHLAHWEGLDLQRVGRRQAIRLARSIAPEGLDEETATQIVARADGVPLFIEEITRAVLDSGLEAGVAEVPATLQTSLLARLDAMGPGKIVAQIGAVIGRTFAHRHIDRLAALYGVEPEPALEQLVESGILFRHGVPPEAYYTFKHALLQDEAYATLLMRRRREIHLAYADMLDEQRGQGEGRAGLVGHHAFAAGDWVRAFDAFAEAGHDAVARSALVEASGQFRRALDAFGRLPETPECAEAGIDLMFSLRNVLWATGRFEAILEPLERAEELAARAKDRVRLGWVSVYRAASLWQLGQAVMSSAACERAARIGEETGDRPLAVASDFYRGCIAVTGGNLNEAQRHFEAVIERLPGDAALELCGLPFAPAVISRSWLVFVHAERGTFGAADREAAEALALAERIGTPFNRAHIGYDIGYQHLVARDCDAAREVLGDTLDMIERWGLTYLAPFTRGFLGYAEMLTGEAGQGAVRLRKAVGEHDVLGLGLFHALVQAMSAEAHLADGQLEEARVGAAAALACARSRGERGFEAYALLVLGLVKAEERAIDEARTSLEAAIAIAEPLSFRPLAARCHVVLAELLGAGLASERHIAAAEALRAPPH